MGKYSVPESIRQMKPKGTMVKNISGHYYVYEYRSVTGADGKRHTEMGKAIGAIREGIGFIPNDSFACDTEITSLDFGEYAITLANSTRTLALLRECFNPEDAARIYTVGVIHFIQGFTYLKDIRNYHDMSILSLRFPGLKMGYESLTKLYDTLGRRQSNVLKLEQRLVEKSSHQAAVDGHVIACESEGNDLAEKGYKFRKLGEAQVNLLMAYDVNTGVPLFSRIYEGASNDKISVQDFIDQVEIHDMLFIVDRGFYSSSNINLFTSNGNAYIIPLAKNQNTCRQAVHSLEMHDRFMYQKGKKASVVEYKDEIIDGYRVLTFRDLNESAAEQENYLRHMSKGDKAYTRENFDKQKYFMGVTVLQTSLEEKAPVEIYTLYKKRWQIETFYNYFKNKANYASLHAEDYYKTQGLAFIMLISALIHQEVEKAAKAVEGKSLDDCLLDARMIKAHKRHGSWKLCNCLKKQTELFKKLNTELIVMPT